MLSSLDQIEARMWRLHQQAEDEAERGPSAKKRSENRQNLQRQLREERSSVARQTGQMQELRERNRDLERQLGEVRSSKSWRALDGINRIKKRVLRLLGRVRARR